MTVHRSSSSPRGPVPPPEPTAPPPAPPDRPVAPSASAGAAPVAPPCVEASAASPVPAFAPGRLRRQLLFDMTLHWAAVVVVLGGLALLLGSAEQSSGLHLLPVLLVFGGWMLMNLISARVTRELPQLTAMVAIDPELAERRLAEHLRRRPLVRWARLMLYHRLAMLRHRQRRFGEAAAICRAVLRHRLGPARDARAHLLLLFTESSLECRDIASAFGALSELNRTRLSLVESLQRLALQTRYELMGGHVEQAIDHSDRKVQLAEVMPAHQCGAMHAMLATAADRAQRAELAQGLWARAELLCPPELIERFRDGEFGVAVVEPDIPRGVAGDRHTH